MQRTFSRMLMAMLMQAALVQAASASTIVDTGTPIVNLLDGAPAVSNGSIGPLQSLAGEFTTSQAFDVTTLSAYVGVYEGVNPISLNDTFHIGLATGPSDPAGASFTTLFSLQASFLSDVTSGSNVTTGWASVDVPSYLLPTGTYWIVVSATSSDSPVGLEMPSGAPNPLAEYAVMSEGFTGWQSPVLAPNGVPDTLGFEVQGTPVSTVPLPGTLGMLLSGMAALSALRRRFL